MFLRNNNKKKQTGEYGTGMNISRIGYSSPFFVFQYLTLTNVKVMVPRKKAHLKLFTEEKKVSILMHMHI